MTTAKSELPQVGHPRTSNGPRRASAPAAALLRKIVIALSATVAVLFSVAVGGGYFLFNRPHVDPLTKADAIIVLGGEWDGRVAYGLDLARQGFAPNVVLSDSYQYHRDAMKRACDGSLADVTVYCFTPDPFTTRGEAMYAAELARTHGWSHLIVVSWNFHMVRARYIFGQCFGGSVTMRPVPRNYDNYGVADWAWTYAYQYTAIVKAAAVGCQTSAD